MYVTRPLSLYRKSPEALDEPPPPGPASGFVVIQDKECEAQQSCLFGLFKNSHLRDLPFPQDRPLKVQTGNIPLYDVFDFIPVINQPLSSNRYYVVLRGGEHKGKVLPPRVEDMDNFCCGLVSEEVMPREIFSTGIYSKEVEIIPCCSCCCCPLGCFGAKSVSPQRYTPPIAWKVKPDGKHSSNNIWTVRSLSRHVYPLTEASGINELVRKGMPKLGYFPDGSPYCSTPVVVGKWYCPFLFVREDEMSLADQVHKTGYYEMLLEQFWQQIYQCGNCNQNRVKVNVAVQTKKPLLYIGGAAQEVVGDTSYGDEKRIQWFEGRNGRRVGLHAEVVKQMTWEEERGGWIEKDEIVDTVEEFYGINGSWSKFKCYVLVERFVLRRMDGTLLLTYDFNHTNKITCKWN